MKTFVLSVAVLLALAACGSDQTSLVDGAPTATPVTDLPTAPPVPSPVASVPPAPVPTVSVVPTPPLPTVVATPGPLPTLIPPTSNEGQRLGDARQLWNRTRPTSYELQYDLVCECDNGPWVVVVDGDKTVDARHLLIPSTDTPFTSIDAIFDDIASTIEAGRFPVKVTYDDQLGYPKNYIFNEPELAIDGGFVLTVTEFITDVVQTCSTSGSQLTLTSQPLLPAAVLAKRQAIYDAAIRCDIAGLAALASPGGFTASFGGGSALQVWTDAERRGEPVLLDLVRHLNLAFTAPLATDGSDAFFTWPSAFNELQAADGTGLPAADYQELLTVYSLEELQSMFDGIGGYVGYRIGITADGQWKYFVAGD